MKPTYAQNRKPSVEYWQRDLQSVEIPYRAANQQPTSFWRLEEPILENGKVKTGGFWPKQLQWWNSQAFIRALVAGYGAGKTLVGAKRCIALALTNSDCMVAAVSPTFPLARKTIIPTLRNLLAGKQTLLKDFWWRFNKSTSEFFIRYHGRTGWIQVMSGEDPESLRGPNVAAAWLDEPFLMQQSVFDQMIARTREPNAVVKEINLTGCITRNSWVTTSRGMIRIGDLDPGTAPKQYRRIDQSLLGVHNEYHSATKFFNNGVDETIKVSLTNGYQLEGTPDHPILCMGSDGIPVFKRMGARKGKHAHLEQVQLGDRVAIARGADSWGNLDPLTDFEPGKGRRRYRLSSPNGMTEDLAYFLGLWVAEGSVDLKEGRVGISCGDKSVSRFLQQVGVLGLRFKKKHAVHHSVSSLQLIELMKHLKMPLTLAPDKYFPQWVMSGRREWALSFLAGMYDGDGHVCRDGSGIGYTTSSEQLAVDLQQVLLNLGIVSHRDSVWNSPTKLCKVWSLVHRVKVSGRNAARLAALLPLRISRKRKQLKPYLRELRDSDTIPGQKELILRAWGSRGSNRWRNGQSSLEPNKIIESVKRNSSIAYSTLRDFIGRWKVNEPTLPDEIIKLERNLLDNYYWAEVRGLEKGRADTVDFVIPDTHSFSSNGIISHNTPEQLNWGYDLLMGELGDQHRKAGTTIEMIQASSRDNLATGREYIQRLEGAFTDRAAEAYIDGGFVNLSKGQVYYAFVSIGKESNVKAMDIPPIGAELGAGMDFNVMPMSAAIFWRLGDHMHFFDEIELPNADTELMCSELYDKYVDEKTRVLKDHQLHYIYPDASGNSRSTKAPRGKTDFHYIREAGFTIRAPHRNPAQKDRYNAVNGKFRPRAGPGTLTISPRCRKLIRYLSTYTHELKNKEEQKKMSHLLDAFSYPVDYLYPAKPSRDGAIPLIGH